MHVCSDSPGSPFQLPERFWLRPPETIRAVGKDRRAGVVSEVSRQGVAQHHSANLLISGLRNRQYMPLSLLGCFDF